MLAEKATEITAAPKTYSDWLDCFEILCGRNVSRDELRFLTMGECTAHEEAIGFLETQLVKTINIMLQRYIRAFGRELEFHTAYGEYDGIYRLFAGLASKINGCMFFTQLDFMSESFRTELRGSVISETEKFWRLTLNTLYSCCTEQSNPLLEDELYMIKRIKLFC